MSSRQWARVAVWCLLPALITACDKLPFDTKSTSEDGEPFIESISPDQIADRIDAGFGPVYALLTELDPDTIVSPTLRTEMTGYANDSMKQFRSNPDATRGFRRASYRLEDRLRECREAQNGEVVLLIADLVKILNPGNQRLGSYTKWAHDQKNRPEVKISGWYQDLAAYEETIFVFLDVTLPGKNEVHSLRARIGDTFHDVELMDILGDRSGILLRYIKTGDLYEVYGRSWEIKQKLIESLEESS
jgi:hypothetical protein